MHGPFVKRHLRQETRCMLHRRIWFYIMHWNIKVQH